MDACNQMISNFTCRRLKSLELNKKVFLSHSGRDKPFVRKLYKALKQRNYDPFFDEDILPKAERITMKDILEEVEISELCVFVISDSFFTVTKNPMLELTSFLSVQEKDPLKKILPLFYKLSVPQLTDQGNQSKWIKKWQEWEKDNKGKENFTVYDVNLEKWKGALNIIGQTNGLDIKESNEEQYIEVIVSHICRIIAPDVQYDVSYVQGKERMCKEVDALFADCENDPTRGSILGIHGLGGLGKTTLSKVLFNYYWSQFEGRVIRIDLDSTSKEENLQQLHMAFEKIKNIHEETLPSLHDVDEAWNLYLRPTGWKKVFLIIDHNANSSLECREEIRKPLKGAFYGESRILILSRSKTLLDDICHGCPNFHSAEMLSLKQEEAEMMCLQRSHFSGREHELSTIQWDIVRDGIQLCRFEGVYHPMALIVLGGWLKLKDWEAVVSCLSKDPKNDLGGGVIGLLKKSFDDMAEKTRRILLDLALYLPSRHSNWSICCDWLSSVNEIDRVQVNNVLTELRERAFLCGDGLEIHELVKELAVLVTRSDKSLGCLYFDNNSHGLGTLGDIADVSNVERFAMESCEIQSSTLCLKDFPRLRVLKIKDIEGLKEIEMARNMMCLQSLEVSSSEFMNSLRNDDGMKIKKPRNAKIVIKSLACCVVLKWMSLENCADSILTQPPLLFRLTSLVGSGNRFIFAQSLRSIRLVTNQRSTFPLQTLDRCCNSLEELELDGFDVGKFCHLPKFSQLRSLHLFHILWARELHFGSLPILEELYIEYAPKLRRICGFEDFEGCESSSLTLLLKNMSSLEYFDLSFLSHVSRLCIYDCGKLNRLDGLEKLHTLHSMVMQNCQGLARLEGLEKIDSLESIVLFNCNGLVSLFEGLAGEDEEINSPLINLKDVFNSKCPNLMEKFGIVNVKALERDKYEYVESILLMWNSFLREFEEREGITHTPLMRKDNIARWKRELVMIGPILQPQTMPVTPCNIPYHYIIPYFYHEFCVEDNLILRAIESFFEMLMVALCWSSQAHRVNIAKQLQAANKCIMTECPSSVTCTTLLPCLIYLWCHGQIPAFLIVLQMAGGMDTILKSWDRHKELSRKSRVHHGIWILAMVGILWPKHLTDLATLIATIYSTTLLDIKIIMDKGGKNSNIMDKPHLPIFAKDAMLRLLNEENVQREFQKRNIRADNLELFNRLLPNMPCWYDLECFLSHSNN